MTLGRINPIIGSDLNFSITDFFKNKIPTGVRLRSRGIHEIGISAKVLKLSY